MVWHHSAARCPVCGLRLNLARVNIARPFPCPACGTELSVDRQYLRFSLWIGNAASVLLVYCLGCRGYALLFGILAAWYPVGVLTSLAVKHLAPPRLYLNPTGSEGDFSTLNLHDPPERRQRR